MRWRDVKQNRVKPKEQKEELKKELPYASIGEKIKAFITDSFLLTMPIIYAVIYAVFGSREEFSLHMGLGWVYILAPLGIIVVLFYVIAGQTPGLKAYDIKVIDNATGEKPNIILAILRFFFFNITLFSFIGLFFSFFRKDGRGIHDMLSGTSIVKADYTTENN